MKLNSILQFFHLFFYHLHGFLCCVLACFCCCCCCRYLYLFNMTSVMTSMMTSGAPLVELTSQCHSHFLSDNLFMCDQEQVFLLESLIRKKCHNNLYINIILSHFSERNMYMPIFLTYTARKRNLLKNAIKFIILNSILIFFKIFIIALKSIYIFVSPRIYLYQVWHNVKFLILDLFLYLVFEMDFFWWITIFIKISSVLLYAVCFIRNVICNLPALPAYAYSSSVM